MTCSRTLLLALSALGCLAFATASLYLGCAYALMLDRPVTATLLYAFGGMWLWYGTVPAGILRRESEQDEE